MSSQSHATRNLAIPRILGAVCDDLRLMGCPLAEAWVPESGCRRWVGLHREVAFATSGSLPPQERRGPQAERVDTQGVLRHGDIEIPPVTEFTFLRKDRFFPAGFVKTFPHPLDYPNADHSPVPLPGIWYGERT